MRKYKRAIARYRMKMDGIERMNRKAFFIGGKLRTGCSFFAKNWRKYLETEKMTKRRRLRAA